MKESSDVLVIFELPRAKGVKEGFLGVLEQSIVGLTVNSVGQTLISFEIRSPFGDDDCAGCDLVVREAAFGVESLAERRVTV